MKMTREEKWIQRGKMLNKWLYLKNVDIPIKKYLEDKGLKRIAVYGLGDIGKRLIEELQNDNFVVEYAVDAKADMLFADFPLYLAKDELPDIDVMIVTVLYEFEEIKMQMPDRLKEKCISLETIVNYLWEECWTN